jgi:hypothetical protein
MFSSSSDDEVRFEKRGEEHIGNNSNKNATGNLRFLIHIKKRAVNWNKKRNNMDFIRGTFLYAFWENDKFLSAKSRRAL